eukprot:39502-Pelagomonas_calceolata.AAC.3
MSFLGLVHSGRRLTGCIKTSKSAVLVNHTATAALAQVAASVLADNEPFKPQQMFLALKHVETGVAAYMVGKAKKGSTYELTANAALIEKQIGKLVSGQSGHRSLEAFRSQ